MVQIVLLQNGQTPKGKRTWGALAKELAAHLQELSLRDDNVVRGVDAITSQLAKLRKVDDGKFAAGVAEKVFATNQKGVSRRGGPGTSATTLRRKGMAERRANGNQDEHVVDDLKAFEAESDEWIALFNKLGSPSVYGGGPGKTGCRAPTKGLVMLATTAEAAELLTAPDRRVRTVGEHMAKQDEEDNDESDSSEDEEMSIQLELSDSVFLPLFLPCSKQDGYAVEVRLFAEVSSWNRLKARLQAKIKAGSQGIRAGGTTLGKCWSKRWADEGQIAATPFGRIRGHIQTIGKGDFKEVFERLDPDNTLNKTAIAEAFYVYSQNLKEDETRLNKLFAKKLQKLGLSTMVQVKSNRDRKGEGWIYVIVAAGLHHDIISELYASVVESSEEEDEDDEEEDEEEEDEDEEEHEDEEDEEEPVVMPSQSKYWMFTVNNPTVGEVDFDPVKDKVGYCIYQLKEGEECGTPHFQGYLELNKRLRLTGVCKLLASVGLKGAHVEVRKGKQAEAIAYCSKEDTRKEGPWTFGEKTDVFQGKRSDLLD